MKARHIMTTRVITARPQATVHDIAALMAEKGVSAVPIVDDGRVVGIVSEGDLLHRRELGTGVQRRRSSWFRFFQDSQAAAEFEAKASGETAEEIMTRDLVTVSEDASLSEIADCLESAGVKRVLVMRGEKLVGLVSRSNLVRALAAKPEGGSAPSAGDDDEVRARVIDLLESIPGTSPWLTTVIVAHGIVDLYGTIEEEAAREPSCTAIERLPHVAMLRDHRVVLQPY